MGNVLRLLRYLPPVFVILLFLIALFYTYIAKLPFKYDDHILYGLVVLSRTTSTTVVQIALLGFIITFFIAAALREILSRKQNVIYGITLILSFITIPLSCWASVFSFAECITMFDHLNRTYYDDELYQLAFIDNPCFGESSYNLYHCDNLGLVCDRVYQLDASSETSYANLGDYKIAQQAELISNSANQSLSIVINGISVYDYHP